MMAGKSFIFRFDDVEVHEREFKLVKAGGALAVEPKAFRVLLILLRNPGKLIGKEDLLNAVWGDAAVTDNSLARSVALLRRLLGDDPRDPRYIETVATVGYRFVCKVEVSENGQEGLASQNPVKIGNGDASQAAPVEAQGGESRRLRRNWLFASAILVVCLLILTSWYPHSASRLCAGTRHLQHPLQNRLST
jgi:DNA-binding winged helix-turn-helix (wHTH) protein